MLQRAAGMKCPRCGEINDPGFRFCRGCGGALPEVDDAAATSALSERDLDFALPSPSQAPATVAIAPPPPARAVYKLVATSGLLRGRTFTIDQKGLIIGRDPANCQVIVADDGVSRLHAWVGFNEDGEVVLKDRHSANGTYVNQVRIQEKILQPTDEISVGNERRHLFRLEEAHPSSDAIATEQVAAPRARGHVGGTSVLNTKDLATEQEEEKTAGGTVKMKVTELIARPHLELIVDKYAVRTLDIPDAGLIVGRDASRCPLVMEHPSVSGVHAEFMFKNDKVILTDRSTNGTFVNGLRASGIELHDGDYITFGRYSGKSLIFRTGLEPELKVESIDLSRDLIT